MQAKTTIADTEPDFGDWEVRLDGTPLANVMSADAEQGVALVRDPKRGVGPHLVHGRISIRKTPLAAAGRNSVSLRLISGASLAELPAVGRFA